MTQVLLHMRRLTSENAIRRDITLPGITALKSLRTVIQDMFGLDHADAFSYEVLGCSAPGCRAKLRDLVVAGVTRFCYVQAGEKKQVVEITIEAPTSVIRDGSNGADRSFRSVALPRTIQDHERH